MSSAHDLHLSPKETLECMLGHLGFVFEVQESRRGETLVLNILTRDPRRLIGKDGHTLDDLQYLLNRLTDRGGEESTERILVDVENHKEREQIQFIDHIKSIAEEVAAKGESRTLQPMNSFERFMVHQALKDHPSVKSRSIDSASRMKQIILDPKTKPA